MPIPNPISFTPLDPLPASQLNDLVENDEALADGSAIDDNAISTGKIADGAITAAKLSATAITLGYTPITSDFTTTSTSPTQVTGLTASVTIPAGSRKIKITAYLPITGTGVDVLTSLWDGTVGSGTQVATMGFTGAGTNYQGNGSLMAVVTPSAGAKTYNVAIQANSGSATVKVKATATAPAFILVEAI